MAAQCGPALTNHSSALMSPFIIDTVISRGLDQDLGCGFILLFVMIHHFHCGQTQQDKHSQCLIDNGKN